MACDYQNCPNSVSIRDIREDLDSMDKRLRDVEKPLDYFGKSLPQIDEKLSLLFERTRKIELKIAYWIGGLSLASFLLGIAVKYYL